MLARGSVSGNGNHRHKGRVKPTKGARSKKKRPKPASPLIVKIGVEKRIRLEPADLDQSDWDELRELCEDANGDVVFTINRYRNWPAGARFNLLAIMRDLGKRARIRVNRSTFAEPFDAVLASMVGCDQMEAHKKGFQAAVEAAGFLYGDMAEAAAAKINDRLQDLHVAKINPQRLAKMIREAADGNEASAEASKAEAAAKGFCEHLADGVEGLSLRFFQGDFYVWQGKRWERQQDDLFQARVMQFLQASGTPKLTERFAKDVIAHLAGMSLLDCWERSMPFWIAPTPKNERRNCLALQNRIICFDPLEDGLRPAQYKLRKNFFNEILLPYSHDSKAKCPLWLETLSRILLKTKDGDNRLNVLQEFFGYSLLRDCRFQKLLVLIGDGGNGRSTVTETWQEMLGEGNYSTVALETLGDNFRQESLRGKLANFSGELNYLNKVNEGMLKRIVSGEPIDINRKHKAPISARLQAKIIVNTNQLPQFNDPTPAMWDRLLAVPFEVRMRGTADEDKLRPKKLLAELPGILNWAIAGLQRLLEQDGFTACSKCAAVTAQHRHDSNSVLTFIDRCCDSDAGMMTVSPPLYQIYRVFTEGAGRKPVAEPEFGARMKRAGYEKKRGREIESRREPAYVGLMLSDEGLEWSFRVEQQFQRRKYSYQNKRSTSKSE